MTTPSRADQRRQRRQQIEARQQQTERGAQRRRLMERLRVVAALGLVVLGVGLLVFWVAREVTAPLPGVPIPDEGRAHVDPGSPLTYKSIPPSSGPHYETAAPWGFSDSKISPGQWVHNLEHGGIVLLYKCPEDCTELKNKLRGLSRSFRPSPRGYVKLLVAPDESIEGRLVALAWDRRDTLDSFDEDRLRRFYEAYLERGSAPEPNAP